MSVDKACLVFKNTGNFMQCEFHWPVTDENEISSAILGMIAMPAYEADEMVREQFRILMQESFSAVSKAFTGKTVDWNRSTN